MTTIYVFNSPGFIGISEAYINPFYYRIDVDHSEGSQNNSSVFDIIKTRFFRKKRKQNQAPVVRYIPTRVGIEDYQGYLSPDRYYKSMPTKRSSSLREEDHL